MYLFVSVCIAVAGSQLYDKQRGRGARLHSVQRRHHVGGQLAAHPVRERGRREPAVHRRTLQHAQVYALSGPRPTAAVQGGDQATLLRG